MAETGNLQGDRALRRKKAFLAALAGEGVVTWACQRAGVSRMQV